MARMKRFPSHQAKGSSVVAFYITRRILGIEFPLIPPARSRCLNKVKGTEIDSNG